jgi:hypothetical protein
MLPLFLKQGGAMAFRSNFQSILSRRHPPSGHPLEGSIAFIVERALRDGTSVSLKHHAQSLLSASLDRRLTLANLEAEISRVAVDRGATVEFG